MMIVYRWYEGLCVFPLVSKKQQRHASPEARWRYEDVPWQCRTASAALICAECPGHLDFGTVHGDMWRGSVA